eukprot:scaffold578133_cov32-Prasinocladus_malaysianus.AAC.2
MSALSLRCTTLFHCLVLQNRNRFITARPGFDTLVPRIDLRLAYSHFGVVFVKDVRLGMCHLCPVVYARLDSGSDSEDDRLSEESDGLFGSLSPPLQAPILTAMTPVKLAAAATPESRERLRVSEELEVQAARSKRKVLERWPLVNAFCSLHGLPPSLALLRDLARQGDWLHFLAEAQTQASL